MVLQTVFGNPLINNNSRPIKALAEAWNNFIFYLLDGVNRVF